MESDLKQLIEQLELKKNELIERAKRMDSRVRYKTVEAKALKEVLSTANVPNFRAIQKKLDFLEFKVATEATTLARERLLMKEIKEVRKVYEQAREVEKRRRKLFLVEGDIKALGEERARVEEEIQRVKKDLQEAYDDLKAGRNAARKEQIAKQRKVEEEDKRQKLLQELGVSNQPLDGEVSLGDIAVIKRKGG